MFLGRPAHAKSAQMDGQMDRYRRLHTDVKTYTSLQPLERATAQIQIQIFIFLEAKKIRLSFLQAWRDKKPFPTHYHKVHIRNLQAYASAADPL